MKLTPRESGKSAVGSASAIASDKAALRDVSILQMLVDTAEHNSEANGQDLSESVGDVDVVQEAARVVGHHGLFEKGQSMFRHFGPSKP